MTAPADWPALPLEQWRDTYETLLRWTQIVGKTRLALAPFQNHWWHVTLYVTARGLGTSAIPVDARTFDIEFDFVDHSLIIRVSDGRMATMPLIAQSVADFYTHYMALLKAFDIHPRIWPVPVEIADRTRFTDDIAHHSYDADAAQQWWRAISEADRLLKEFRSGFLGKCSPSHFFWGGFDLACTRFSGKKAPVHPGGIPNTPDFVTREGYSHECISAGWWAGTPDGPVSEPAFYAYAYPEPAGCATAKVQPDGCYYHPDMHIWVLPYDAVRNAENRDAMVLDFFASTYAAAADLGMWDRTALERNYK
jgi:hypothetical protein